jgi:hypothetical protein
MVRLQYLSEMRVYRRLIQRALHWDNVSSGERRSRLLAKRQRDDSMAASGANNERVLTLSQTANGQPLRNGCRHDSHVVSLWAFLNKASCWPKGKPLDSVTRIRPFDRYPPAVSWPGRKRSFLIVSGLQKHGEWRNCIMMSQNWPFLHVLLPGLVLIG